MTMGSRPVTTGGETGFLYSVRPAFKLCTLFVLSIALFSTHSLLILGAMSGIVFVGALVMCPSALKQWLCTWVLLLTIAVVVIWTAFAISMEAALITLLRLASLSLFATMVTVTTSIGQFIDTITNFARPLEKTGLVNARDIGLAIGLVIRFVPDVQARYRAVAEAHRARGLKLRLSTIIVPMVIGTLQSAEEIANAIDARNIRGPQEKL
ncbi:biotin transport system permease protein [Paenochrobactrum gallinarii]|uniref:Biotin transport system permease protein n=1 Tax=Paenochrobactrum gallinarii TaxID=643673 RepID=A0A841LYJ4_9HYPH|nr:energy-coupling factor transporter transmembrane component T [Paenochrobactrum gallinarii]MBB6261920.1 biotin transport system permease protein [Paenochrobactrum gallinarii]